MRKSTGDPAYVMHSVDHALTLLRLFSERQRLRIGDIVQALGVAPSTASRLVTMLELHDYVEKDRTSRGYVVGRGLRSLGENAVHERDVRPQVQPCLESLAAETGATAQFGVLRGSTVVFTCGVEGPKRAHAAARVGELLPAHSCATGKVLLSLLPADDLSSLYASERLPQLTTQTCTNRRRLFTQLRRVRRDGLATSVGENTDGIFSVAVPVIDALGRTRGALSVAAPASRCSHRQQDLLTRALVRGARAFTAQLV